MNFNYKGEEVAVKFERYKSNGRLAVLLEDSDGRAFATLSANVREVKDLASDEFVAKTYSENEEIARAARHLFIDTGRMVQVGYAICPVWRLRHPPKVVVIRSGEPVAIFDTGVEARAYVGRQAEQHYFKIEEVPYKP